MRLSRRHLVGRDLDFNPRTPGGVRPGQLTGFRLFCNFNPRTPGGVRRPSFVTVRLTSLFQSSHPWRGATRNFSSTVRHRRYFNPRTPGGVRPCNCSLSTTWGRFQSSHPWRGATSAILHTAAISAFQSSHPWRGATWLLSGDCIGIVFQSSHPWRGATPQHARVPVSHAHFNPRTPGGVRLGKATKQRQNKYFNPRTPGGVRRYYLDGRKRGINISILAPLAGCD